MESVGVFLPDFGYKADMYLGNYDFKKRWGEAEVRFKQLMGLKSSITAEIDQSGADAQSQSDSSETERPLSELDRILQEIQNLAKEAGNYCDTHIRADFRRINATLLEIQVKLDRIFADGDADVRAKVKKGIIQSEDAANLLMNKIHRDYKKCADCLKL